MSTKLTIRPVTANDLVSIFEIETQSFGTESFNRRQFRYLAKSPTCHFVVADIDNQIGGYLILTTRRNSKVLRIYSIATKPRFRGLGIGEKLMNYTKDFARINAYNAISLEVKEANTVAITLYQKMGFTSISKKMDYYDEGENALVMRLTCKV
ncbi:ribosomal protein S18-alanine N-acetyltransferase [Perlabentimonas gracilis]|uniref:ribosomal protein S18-alanine N-acetyltransferase n=1 Tax=Perlabentimonas gracilis TaxID=2715279 RepID=UPI001407A730|nr:ribosomal protein S18-alanine N-acetyltransferase [Perlabentimonas gracilis]NHB70316.1 ribosomal protein S18-alanine N-acetyltransferase [Perlabentimonas gracilis]